METGNYGKGAGSWCQCYPCPTPTAGAPAIAHLANPLVDATIMVYSTIISQLLPTPAKSHYTFNLRDLSKVFQGMLMADPAKVEVSSTGHLPLIPHDQISLSLEQD